MTASSVARQPVSQVRIGAASLIGTTVEYYDFAIYGLAAALVFPHVFFADNDPFVATVLALGTFAVGFIARPLGGLFFGHFGDRIGRKRMLVLSLFLMGVVTLLIGLLPSTQTIGVAAPILLVILRFVQGFAFGGEWGGAILLAYESSPESRRGFSAALPQTGPPAGILLGNMAFLAVAQLPDEQLYSWGWRIPFLCSAILVIVGLVIRAGIGESIDFENAKKNGETSTAPIRTVFQTSTGTIVLVAGAFLGFGSLSLIAINFLVSYGTSSEVGFSRSEILTAVLIANAAQLFMTPLGGALVDRIGMSRVMGTSIVGCIVTAAFLIYAVSTGNLIITIIGYLVCMSVFFSFGYAAQGSLFAGAFTPDVRYTGMSLGFQLSNVLGSAISPIIATVLVRETGSIYSVIVYVTAVLIFSGICTAVLVKRRTADHGAHTPSVQVTARDEVEATEPA
ncbi:MFS transporter [Gordonia aichiensis]|uniref:Putative major facilitator superfamily transporter n=1 Tax=Gordonia aichiensis NBRC 108223 TaxID=1220583 RepID=L7KQZ3_9ACTN|nr:MFS transporter [Gordonia aichiensis]GAC51014.1 putative major facilitator superfamily transporter [Gordonia aichiensis NBRC 108223]